MRWGIAIFCLAALGAHADTIYLCRTGAGGTFWAQTNCSQHQALVIRAANVPSNMEFKQQVQIAEGAQSECSALDRDIAKYDALARQPQSGQTQDWISAQRKKARDRQFEIKCR
jgi:hypothetical protein